MRPSNYFLMLFSLSLSSVRRVACQEEPMMRQPDLAPGENFPGTTLQCLVCQARSLDFYLFLDHLQS